MTSIHKHFAGGMIIAGTKLREPRGKITQLLEGRGSKEAKVWLQAPHRGHPFQICKESHNPTYQDRHTLKKPRCWKVTPHKTFRKFFQKIIICLKGWIEIESWRVKEKSKKYLLEKIICKIKDAMKASFLRSGKRPSLTVAFITWCRILTGVRKAVRKRFWIT